MIKGGLVTVMVSDMDNLIGFYTETLGLNLRYRAGDEWAEIDAGPGLVLGLHRASPHAPRPGTPSPLSIGFLVTGTLEEAVENLRDKGVRFGRINDNPEEGARLAFFNDPDGNSMYLYEAVAQEH